jgi:hypothetical protein
MKTFILSAAALAVTILPLPALAQNAGNNLQVNISYGEKADKAFTETYGNRERETIREMVTRSLRRALGDQAARVDITINDVTPNRPTFKQLGDNASLSSQSFGIGGADVKGSAFDAQGKLLAEVEYDWYGDIQWAYGAWTWTDADSALDRFSRLLAREVPG